jgi:1,4-dihydroxy-2-naphthoate octaprenyltransferase
MQNFKIWLSAIRVRTLPLSIAGIILAGCLAHYNGYFDIGIFILAILTTLSFQILSNLANDYGDGVKGTDNENRIGPERAIQSGKLTPEEMYNSVKVAILISLGLSFILIFNAFGLNNFLYSILFFALAIISIMASIRYTMGKSAYGYKGFGDLYVFIFFGVVSVIGGYFLFAKHIDHIIILPAISIGLLSVAVLNLNNMRDIESDKMVGKNTLAVKLGHVKAKRYHFILVIGAILSTLLFLIFYYVSLMNLIFIIGLIPLILHLRIVKSITEPHLFDPQLKKLALSTVFLALLIGVGYIL